MEDLWIVGGSDEPIGIRGRRRSPGRRHHRCVPMRRQGSSKKL